MDMPHAHALERYAEKKPLDAGTLEFLENVLLLDNALIRRQVRSTRSQQVSGIASRFDRYVWRHGSSCRDTESIAHNVVAMKLDLSPIGEMERTP